MPELNTELSIKLLSQALLLVGGLGALFWPDKSTKTESGRRLNWLGWTKALSILAGFLLFGVGEFAAEDRKRQTKSAADKQATTIKQQLTLSEQQLFLAESQTKRLTTLTQQQDAVIRSQAVLKELQADVLRRQQAFDLARTRLSSLLVTWSSGDDPSIAETHWQAALTMMREAADPGRFFVSQQRLMTGTYGEWQQRCDGPISDVPDGCYLSFAGRQIAAGIDAQARGARRENPQAFRLLGGTTSYPMPRFTLSSLDRDLLDHRMTEAVQFAKLSASGRPLLVVSATFKPTSIRYDEIESLFLSPERGEWSLRSDDPRVSFERAVLMRAANELRRQPLLVKPAFKPEAAPQP